MRMSDMIEEFIKELFNENDEYIEIIDIMKREELAVLNTISTAHQQTRQNGDQG